ncbi:MAG: hypothetical protein AAF985_19105, partial [Bacteroidota bacterium]
MKRFHRFSIFLCFCVLLTGTLQARHILGGSVTYVQTNDFTYQISIEILRDCNGGGAQFDDPAAISIYNDQNELQQSFHESIDLIEPIDLMPQNTVCIFPNGICVEKGTYVFEITLPQNSGSYTISYQRCCRANIINNLVNPGEIGMTFTTEINTNIYNNSPVFSNDIPLANFSGVSFIYDGSATDA